MISESIPVRQVTRVAAGSRMCHQSEILPSKGQTPNVCTRRKGGRRSDSKTRGAVAGRSTQDIAYASSMEGSQKSVNSGGCAPIECSWVVETASVLWRVFARLAEADCTSVGEAKVTMQD